MRYAIYFAPSRHDPLTEAAGRWLGRDAYGAGDLPPPDALDLERSGWQAVVAEPRRYGFHATLKAPFALQAGRSEEELLAELERFATSVPAFDIPEIIIGQLGPFFALVPAAVHPPLQDFAAQVVEHFEPFRAPLSDADVARRRPDRLTQTQRGHLDRWGYPYVMDEFRFHMTLTGPVEPRVASRMREELDRHFGSFAGRPLSIDGLALFVEPTRGSPFTIHRWLPLRPAVQTRKNIA